VAGGTGLVRRYLGRGNHGSLSNRRLALIVYDYIRTDLHRDI
jgi:hypothetical protein